MTEKKYIDVQAWLRQCNPSWMYYDTAKKIIEAAPVAEVFGQWIDAAEQPPTEPDEYIVMIAGAAGSTVLHFDIDDEGKGVWFEEVEDSTNFYKVTHWMALPAAPGKCRVQNAECRVEDVAFKKPNVCTCKACGAEIVFVMMRSGAKMPCDAELIHAVEERDAKSSFVLPGGIVRRGREGTFASAAGGRGSEQKGVAAVAEGEGAKATDARCGNGNRERHPNGEADFVGYRSHFETCPQADRFRKRGQGDG